MKPFTHSCIAILMMALSISANANPCDDGGIGGTGIPLSRGIGGTGITSNASAGIGGTGITSAQEGIGGTGVTGTQKGIGGTGITNKGIGGTGLEANSGIGGTGIVGVITGFGSICVNGLEVFYFTDTPVDLDGKKISSEALSIGQVVAVKASGKEQSLIAHEIHAFYQITGPITAIDITTNKIKVMGQSVNTNGAQVSNMQVGQWVSVSGLRKEDGSTEASRIDLTSERKIVSSVGTLSKQGNKVYVGGTKIDGISKVDNNNNADTSLTGVWDGNTFNVKDMKPGPVSDLLQKVEVFHLQGIASNNLSNGQVRLSGQNVSVPANAKISSDSSTKSLVGKPIVVHGHMKDGKAIAQSIELRPMKNDVKNRQEQQINASQYKSSNESGEKNNVKTSEVTDSKSEHKSKKIDKTELSERIANRDKVERVETPEKIEKIERVERVETPEKIERVERVERHDD